LDHHLVHPLAGCSRAAKPARKRDFVRGFARPGLKA
jgi:hypothetical protein